MSEIQPNLCVQLDHYRLISVAGIDAEKYLQGQLTCDVTKLADGEQTLTCHCDPKGKMSALLRLYRQSAEQFFIILRKELLPEALVQLRKYAVFSKVTFTELDTPIFGSTDPQYFAKSSDFSPPCKLVGSPDRYLIWGDVAVETNGDSELWDLLDIQQGVPILHPKNQFELIPQAANLQMIEQAISFTKGCYIGQETVARAKYRGANKRAMFTFVGEFDGGELPDIASPIEMQLGEHWKTTGVVLSRILHNNRLWLQVILNKDVEQDVPFRVGNIDLQIHPLPYSLDEE
ncbi:MAG: folate-binding protein [Pasteurellaceae bacterium]|nr:folate-binding protein [Pasteurellaceae bacterium]